MESAPARNKELSNEQLDRLRKLPQYLSTDGPEFILYNLVDKQSNTGLFKNERLLILNLKNESLSYLSKLPQGLIPFLNEHEVASQAAKEKIVQDEICENGVNKFSCRELPDKNGIEIKLAKSSKKVEWVLYFGTRELMSEWFRHISFLFQSSRQEIDAYYHKRVEPSIKPAQLEQLQNQPSHLKQPENIQAQGRNQEIANLSNRNSALKTQEDKFNSPNQRQLSPGNNQLDKGMSRDQPFRGSNIQGVEPILHINEAVHSKQKQSDFDQFHQNTPFGTFIRSKQPSVINESPNKYHEASASRNNEEIAGSKYFTAHESRSNHQKSQYFSNDPEENFELGRTRKYKGILNEFQQPRLRDRENKKERQMLRIEPSKDPENSRISEEMPSNESHLHRSGIIKKNRPTQSAEKDLPAMRQHQTQWNRLYYNQQTNKSLVYFQFVNQCLSHVMPIVDELPYRNNTDFIHNSEDYLVKVENGIEYKLGIQLDKQESMIYELTLNQPLVSDLYGYIDRLKQEFAMRKQLFTESAGNRHPLVLFLEYKQVPILCRAISDVSGSETIPQFNTSRSKVVQDQVLSKMQNAALDITSTFDFRQEMRKNNVATLDWGYLWKKSSNINFQRIFLSEIYCKIFLNILRSEVYQIYINFPLPECPNPSPKLVEEILSDSSIHLVSRLFDNNEESSLLWEVIYKEAQRLYGIGEKKQSINQNYLFYAIMFNSGMKSDELSSEIEDLYQPLANKIRGDRNQVKFEPLVQCLNYEEMAPLFITISQLIPSSSQDYQQLLNLREQANAQIPASINYLERQINLSLSKSIAYDRKGPSAKIYSILNKNQPSYYHYETAISAVRWLMGYSSQQAGDLSFRKIEQIIYYVGKIPLVSRFYQTIAEEQFLKGDYTKGVLNYQHSIDELASVLSPLSNVVFEKRKKIADIYYEFNRKEECLSELTHCKKKCEANKQEAKGEYVKIMIKLAKLSLSMSKYNQAINSSLQCLKLLQDRNKFQSEAESQENERIFFEVAELLLRSFQLTKRSEESLNITTLCLQRCKGMRQFKKYQRLLKIVLLPYLKSCDFQSSYCLLNLVDQLSQVFQEKRLNSHTLTLWANQTQLVSQLENSLPHYFRHLKGMLDKIEKQKLFEVFQTHLEEYFEETNHKSETLVFVMNFFLVVNLVGKAFFQALLKDAYYE